MASKGKEVAGKLSFYKRKRGAGDDDETCGGRKRKNRGVLQLFDDGEVKEEVKEEEEEDGEGEEKGEAIREGEEEEETIGEEEEKGEATGEEEEEEEEGEGEEKGEATGGEEEEEGEATREESNQWGEEAENVSFKEKESHGSDISSSTKQSNVPSDAATISSSNPQEPSLLDTGAARPLSQDTEMAPPPLVIGASSNVPMATVDQGKRLSSVFQGVKVKPRYVAILHAIWQKHGDISKKAVVLHPAGKVFALEALGEIVLMLMTRTGKDVTAKDLETLSFLPGLKAWNFELGWLMPCVAKAEAIFRERASIENIKKQESLLETAKARVASLEEALETARNLLRNRASLEGDVDLSSNLLNNLW